MSLQYPSNQKKTNVWFFVGKSIGVTLLGLYALEQARIGRSNTRYFLVFTHASAADTEIVRMYPHIELIYLCWNNVIPLFFVFAQTVFKENIFVYPPRFGRPPFLVLFFSRLLSLIDKDSAVLGSLLDTQKTDSFWYSKTVKTDLHKNIFAAVAEMVSDTEASKKVSPSLLFSFDEKLARQLPDKYIVFHPFAANEGRTYPDSLSEILLRHLLKVYPEHTIIISAGPNDVQRARKLITQIELAQGTLALIQEYVKNSFTKTIQVLSSAQLYVGVDTGITHLAAHLHVPSVVLGNRSNPMWLPTYSPYVSVLYNEQVCTCTSYKNGSCVKVIDGNKYYRCMVDISWQSISYAIELRIHG